MTELVISRFYRSLLVTDPKQLSAKNIAALIGMELREWEFSSELVDYKGKYKVFINENLNRPQKWQDFGHEMKHYFYDGGSQAHLTDLFKCYQEKKADYFAYHFCVPTFMLQQLKEVTAHDIARIFNVEFDFALRRLDMYKSSIITGGRRIWQKDMFCLGEVKSGN